MMLDTEYGYGAWHSDPVKAQEFMDALDDAIQTLSSEDPLSASDAERVFPGLFRILCDKESEMDFDDAWDTMDHLGLRHAAAIPVLTKELMTGRHTGRCQYVGEYAIRALQKIDPDGSQTRSILEPFLLNPDPTLRNRAAKTLKTLDHSRSWMSWLFRR